MPAPRADFACLSPKCRQDGAATVYELPVAAKRCAVCGSTRISRLYNAINVSSGLARKVDAVVEPAYTDAMAKKDEAKEAVTQRRIAPGFGVPVGNIGGALASIGGQFGAALGMPLPNAGKATLLPRAPTPIPMRPPSPGGGSLRDREFTIKNGQAAKA